MSTVLGLTYKRIYGIIIKINNSEGDTDMGLFKSKASRELDGIIREMKLNLAMVVESEGLNPTGLEEVARCIEFLKKNG